MKKKFIIGMLGLCMALNSATGIVWADEMECVDRSIYSDSEEIIFHPAYITGSSILLSHSGNTWCMTATGDSNVTKISATLTLYKKVGNAYVKQTSWSNTASVSTMRLSGTYATSSGTYKLEAKVVSYQGTNSRTVSKTKTFEL